MQVSNITVTINEVPIEFRVISQSAGDKSPATWRADHTYDGQGLAADVMVSDLPTLAATSRNNKANTLRNLTFTGRVPFTLSDCNGSCPPVKSAAFAPFRLDVAIPFDTKGDFRPHVASIIAGVFASQEFRNWLESA